MKIILLVEPNFPYPTKSKNNAGSVHKNFIPIGLLKFSSYYKDRGCSVKLVRGKVPVEEIGIYPNEILVTSIFTYWSEYVWDVIAYYRKIFRKSEIKLGGIYPTLHSENKEFKNLVDKYGVKVFCGVQDYVEKYLPDYSLIPEVEHHATHIMRGCIRKCSFCGTWKIEPKIVYKDKAQIINELISVGKNKVVFYDNNILANPHIKEILEAFSTLKINKKPVLFESQSGFDGRLLENNLSLAKLIKQARFQNVRIAWDGKLKDYSSIKSQITLLKKAGYGPKDISIFMIYNFDLPFEEMMAKLKWCMKLGVQITDCRYRPLEATYDHYNPNTKKGQTTKDYYIHKEAGWTDEKVRLFRKNVREHNIWIRYAKDKGLEYDKEMEKWSAINNTYKFFKLGSPPKMEEFKKNEKLREKLTLLNKIKTIATKEKKFKIELSGFSNKKIIELYSKMTKVKIS